VTACVALLHPNALDGGKTPSDAVRYALVMPTAGSAASRFFAPLLESLQTGAEWAMTGPLGDALAENQAFVTTCKDLYSWLQGHIDLVLSPLSAMPLYPLMWLLAAALLSIEHDFAASAVVKYIVAATLGLFFAVLWVVVVLYK
jgi:hypothetical protein